jgi:putative thioredoxin
MYHSPYVFDVDEQTFPAKVIDASHQGPVLVDFWAQWCAPCISLAPHLERVVHDCAGAIRLAKLEVDDNMRLAGHYRLRGFPTVILFSCGQEVARFSGTRASPWIHSWIDKHAADLLPGLAQEPKRAV